MVAVDRRTRWKNSSAEQKFFTVLPYASFLMVASAPLQWVGLTVIGEQIAKTSIFSNTNATETFFAMFFGGALAITDVLCGAALLGYAGYGVYKGVRRMIPRKEEW